MKTNKVYKIVRPIGNKMRSWAINQHSLEYKIDVVTTPIFGKIFVFVDLADVAQHYKNQNLGGEGCIVLVCEAPEVEPISEVCYGGYNGAYFPQLWDGTLKENLKDKPPPNSYVTEWVKPVGFVLRFSDMPNWYQDEATKVIGRFFADEIAAQMDKK